MSDELSQDEADYLLALDKKRASQDLVAWPDLGTKVTVDLLSSDEREGFLLDVSRSYVKLSKLTLQNRARVTVVLVRLEIDGANHRNPDDEEVPCPHIHLYREGFGHKWAYPVPSEHFKDLTDRKQTVQDFMKYCNIVEPPEFSDGLFS